MRRVVATFALFLAAGCSHASALPAAAAAPVDRAGVLLAAACRGIDLRPQEGTLDEGALATFLSARGVRVHVTQARADLAYFDVTEDTLAVRLRVARLPSAVEAAQDLHRAVDEHGAGAWGVHRSNIAVLAPAADRDRVVAFAVKTGLACWGVLTVDGRDGAYVIPGGYSEL